MFNLKENKLAKIILFIIVLSGFILVLANSQLKVTEVSAYVVAVEVHEDHLGFGTVFPGEEHQGDFTVYYVEESGQDTVAYQIIQRPKPRAEDHLEIIYPNSFPDGIEAWDYCLNQTEDSEYLTYCYRNLCPFLTKVEEGGDLEDSAFVGKTDASDKWTIYFKVPAIVGHVGQEHINGIVTTNGEYGCDISIEVL